MLRKMQCDKKFDKKLFDKDKKRNILSHIVYI